MYKKEKKQTMEVWEKEPQFVYEVRFSTTKLKEKFYKKWDIFESNEELDQRYFIKRTKRY